MSGKGTHIFTAACGATGRCGRQLQGAPVRMKGFSVNDAELRLPSDGRVSRRWSAAAPSKPVDKADRWIRIAVLLLLSGLACGHVLMLGPVPFHADELFFRDQAGAFAGDVLAFAADSFDRLRFYRVLGRPINFSAYAWGGDYPVILTAVITVGTCALIYAYAALLGRLLGNTSNAFHGLLVLLILAIPFSCYLVLTRAVFHEICSMALVAACFWMLHRALNTDRFMPWFIGAAVTYTVSLFVYESALLVPAFLIAVTWMARKRMDVRGSSAGFGALLLAGAAVYLGSQFINADSQPKLSDSMAIYAPYNAGLTYPEQFLRAALYALYHLKWSWVTVAQQAVEGSLLASVLPILVLAVACVLFYLLLGNRRAFLNGGDALVAVKLGAVLFACTFGLWTYYWVFKKSIVLPPLYTMLFPAIGLACALAGLISCNARIVLQSRAVRASITALFVAALATSLVLILSSRYAIEEVTREVEAYAEQIDGSYSAGASRYRNLVIFDLPEKSMYGRRKIRYESMLLHQLRRRGDHWNNVSVVTNAVSVRRGSEIRAVPSGAILRRSETLYLTRDAPSGRLVQLDDGDLRDTPRKGLRRVDPFRVALPGYELGYNEARANVVLIKRGDAENEHQ